MALEVEAGPLVSTWRSLGYLRLSIVEEVEAGGSSASCLQMAEGSMAMYLVRDRRPYPVFLLVLIIPVWGYERHVACLCLWDCAFTGSFFQAVLCLSKLWG